MRVHETVLYASDVTGAATFYRDALGLRAISPPDDHAAAFRLDGDGVLLIFDPDRSSAAGRYVPSHGAHGQGHVAFAVVPGGLEPAIAQLADSGVAIEREITWPLGGRSVYVRDPAGNSVELIEGDIWEP
jgi:catechol 2,3-dioxygenase-like lactoylglutathione lyase family enzyme